MLHEREKFEDTARSLWSQEFLRKVLGNRRLILDLREDSWLLRVLGIMNRDASVSPNKMRKLLQVNHMVSLIESELDYLYTTFSHVNILDAACGNSYLSLVLGWVAEKKWPGRSRIVGVDIQQKFTKASENRAAKLGIGDRYSFEFSDINQFDWKRHMLRRLNEDVYEPKKMRPHLVVGLHACDTATDSILAKGIELGADVIAVAPCCQAELAAFLSSNKFGRENPLAPMFAIPNLRRESAATFTDFLRIALLRSLGYKVKATEFIESDHTPKNRLIVCERKGKYLKSAIQDYNRAHQMLGNFSIKLFSLLPEEKKSYFRF